MAASHLLQCLRYHWCASGHDMDLVICPYGVTCFCVFLWECHNSEFLKGLPLTYYFLDEFTFWLFIQLGLSLEKHQFPPHLVTVQTTW